VAAEGRLSEPEDWFGYFWPPGPGEDQARAARAGRLSYEPEDGSNVRLIGGFDDPLLSVVHGSIEGVPVTLLDCVATSTRMNAFNRAPLHQEIDPHLVLYGINLDDPAERCFKAMEIEIENLSQWSAAQDITLRFKYGSPEVPSDRNDQSTSGRIGTPFRRLFRWRQEQSSQREETSQPDRAGATHRTGWGIEGEPADERVAELGDIRAELRRTYLLPNWDNRRDRTEVATSATSVLHFESTRSRSIDEWEQVARMAQDLLSLATFSPCAVLRHTVIPDDNRRASDPTVRSNVHVYAGQIVTVASNEPAMDAREMLFTLSDIDFGIVLPRWSKVREMLGPTCNMILGLKYIPGGYLETKLLTAAGAAEVMESSLSRGLNRPLPVPKAEFKALRKALLCRAPEEYRDWLDKKLYNAPSLQDKLTILATQLDNRVVQTLLPNVKYWARRTTYARNDLTHRGESKRVAPPEMSAAVNLTVAVVVITLLDQLEIPAPRILQALEHHPDLKHAPSLARKYWPAGAGEETDEGDSTGCA
jgi:hypothetical protein